LTCDFWAENAKNNCKGKKTKANQSLRPSGFAPAFGRAVGPSAWLFMARVNACPSDALAGARRGRAWIRKAEGEDDSRGLRAGFMARVNVGLPGRGRAWIRRAEGEDDSRAFGSGFSGARERVPFRCGGEGRGRAWV
jgi:hypothetical protein